MRTYEETKAVPKLGEGVPIRYWPNPEGSECANLLAGTENVADHRQTRHNTIVHAHAAMVWGRRQQWPGLPKQSHPQHKDRLKSAKNV